METRALSRLRARLKADVDSTLTWVSGRAAPVPSPGDGPGTLAEPTLEGSGQAQLGSLRSTSL